MGFNPEGAAIVRRFHPVLRSGFKCNIARVQTGEVGTRCRVESCCLQKGRELQRSGLVVGFVPGPEPHHSFRDCLPSDRSGRCAPSKVPPRSVPWLPSFLPSGMDI